MLTKDALCLKNCKSLYMIVLDGHWYRYGDPCCDVILIGKSRGGLGLM